MDFASILRYSLLRQTTHKATCQSCKQFTNFSAKRSISSCDLPPILAVNASVYNEESPEVWLDARNEAFLKSRVRIHGQVEGIDDPVAAEYQLRVGWVAGFSLVRCLPLTTVTGCPGCHKRTAFTPCGNCKRYIYLVFCFTQVSSLS